MAGMNLPNPSMEVVGSKLRFTWLNPRNEDELLYPVIVEVDRIAETRGDGIKGEITVLDVMLPERPGLLKEGSINLLSPTAKRDLAKGLTERMGEPDWAGMLEQVSYYAKRQHRQGKPASDTRKIDPYAKARWLFYPYLETEDLGMIYAAGKSGKSLEATGIATCIAAGIEKSALGELRGEGGPVYYADWESNERILTERIIAVASGFGLDERPPIYHKRMVASLEESADDMRAEMDRLGCVACVIDSFGFARNGEPEDARTTIKGILAARSLGRPVLILDHISHASIRAQQQPAGRGQGDVDVTPMPFGSAYSVNGIRVAWAMQKIQQPGESKSTIVLRNTATNNGVLMPKRGLQVDFRTTPDGEHLECVTFTERNLASVREVRAAPLDQRIMSLLGREGIKPAEAIAESLGETAAKVERELTEMDKRQKVIFLADRGGYGLRAGRAG